MRMVKPVKIRRECMLCEMYFLKIATKIGGISFVSAS